MVRRIDSSFGLKFLDNMLTPAMKISQETWQIMSQCPSHAGQRRCGSLVPPFTGAAGGWSKGVWDQEGPGAFGQGHVGDWFCGRWPLEVEGMLDNNDNSKNGAIFGYLWGIVVPQWCGSEGDIWSAQSTCGAAAAFAWRLGESWRIEIFACPAACSTLHTHILCQIMPNPEMTSAASQHKSSGRSLKWLCKAIPNSFSHGCLPQQSSLHGSAKAWSTSSNNLPARWCWTSGWPCPLKAGELAIRSSGISCAAKVMRRADADQAPSRTSQVALADAAGHGGEVEGGDWRLWRSWDSWRVGISMVS